MNLTSLILRRETGSSFQYQRDCDLKRVILGNTSSMRLNRSGLYIQYQVISAHNVPYTSRKARHELDIVRVLQLQGNSRVCGKLAKA
ncbi:unnamed protein product [Trifolium pratense]|uniref:Uncharacterized protein n=1 Tax=Trifolium pratense TaxID=57577 RepID=A0ACB0LA23_TRIPR|nr:unnamed protein product [Trifolium pratense]